MKLIHSFWTKPMIEKRWKIENQLEKNFWLFAYSFFCAKRFCSKITLHTDDLGLKYYDEFGYDEIKTTLNVLQNEASRFWSKGKMIALDSEPLGSIHIDGDVFLKSPKMIEVMDFQNYDLIVQCEERLGIFMQHYFDTIHHYPKSLDIIPDGFNVNLKHSLNCGVLGFNSQKLKDEYLTGYFSMVEQLKSNSEFMRELALNPKFEPNIVIEQYFLAGYVDKFKVKFKNVLPLTSDATDEIGTVNEMNSIANEIGYAHAWGDTKYKIIFDIKEKIKKQDFIFYNKINTIINKISRWQNA